MDDTQESLLSTLDEIEESELERAAQFAYVDNITTCSCRGMCLRERGRNACPRRSVAQLCSTACHSGTGRSACLHKNSILGENSSDSEDETDNSIAPYSEIEEQSEASESERRSRGRRRGRSRASRQGRRPRRTRGHVRRGHGRERSRSRERERRPTRQGRGRGRLMPEGNSEQRVADHEELLQRMIQGLNLGALRVLALELLRTQPAVFADLINGTLPQYQQHQVLPEQGHPDQDEPQNINPDQGINAPDQNEPEPGDPRPGQNPPEWCNCGMCRPMPTQIENKCCCTRRMECITTQSLFNQFVLDGNVLDIAMRYREDVLVLENARNNENFRHAAYRQFILSQHGRLGQGNRRVIPSCCVLAIRARYFSANGIYRGFRAARLPQK